MVLRLFARARPVTDGALRRLADPPDGSSVPAFSLAHLCLHVNVHGTRRRHKETFTTLSRRRGGATLRHKSDDRKSMGRFKAKQS
jgi:hypothetical protein